MLMDELKKLDNEQFLENLKKQYEDDPFLTQEKIDEIVQIYYGLK